MRLHFIAPNHYERIKDQYKPFDLSLTPKTNGRLYSHLGIYQIRAQGSERVKIILKALILAIATLSIAIWISKELRANLCGKKVERLMVEKPPQVVVAVAVDPKANVTRSIGWLRSSPGDSISTGNKNETFVPKQLKSSPISEKSTSEHTKSVGISVDKNVKVDLGPFLT